VGQFCRVTATPVAPTRRSWSTGCARACWPPARAARLTAPVISPECDVRGRAAPS
jgi:hypothetical protein